MSKSFTMTVVAPRRSTPFVFLKVFDTLDEAIIWSRGEIRKKDAEYILIREGEYASDPVVWDSRVQGPAIEFPIWTHTPVPEGFPLLEVNTRFEERAQSILGDHDSSVDFNKHYIKGDLYTDYRYVKPAVRMAWMMYLDLALEHYDRFGAVV